MDSNVFEIIVNTTEIITKNPIVNIAKNRQVGQNSAAATVNSTI